MTFLCLCRLTEVLKKLATGEEKIDMTRISNLVHRKVLDSLSAVSSYIFIYESQPFNRLIFLRIAQLKSLK